MSNYSYPTICTLKTVIIDHIHDHGVMVFYYLKSNHIYDTASSIIIKLFPESETRVLASMLSLHYDKNKAYYVEILNIRLFLLKPANE